MVGALWFLSPAHGITPVTVHHNSQVVSGYFDSNTKQPQMRLAVDSRQGMFKVLPSTLRELYPD